MGRKLVVYISEIGEGPWDDMHCPLQPIQQGGTVYTVLQHQRPCLEACTYIYIYYNISIQYKTIYIYIYIISLPTVGLFESGISNFGYMK